MIDVLAEKNLVLLNSLSLTSPVFMILFLFKGAFLINLFNVVRQPAVLVKHAYGLVEVLHCLLVIAKVYAAKRRLVVEVGFKLQLIIIELALILDAVLEAFQCFLILSQLIQCIPFGIECDECVLLQQGLFKVFEGFTVLAGLFEASGPCTGRSSGPNRTGSHRNSLPSGHRHTFLPVLKAQPLPL